MDELLEMEIKFKEELLRQYKRISDLSGMSDRAQEETINRLLDDSLSFTEEVKSSE